MHPHAQTFVDMQISPDTRRAYAQDLRRWFAFADDKLPNDAKYDEVVKFRDHLVEALAPTSASRCFSTVRTFGRWLIQIDAADRNPFEAVKRPKRIKNATPYVPTDEEVDELLSASIEYPHRRAVIWLLLNGLRASEAGRLMKDDIRWDDAAQGWYMKVVGKGQKERLVPLLTDAHAALQYFWEWTTAEPSIYAVHDVFGAPFTNVAIGHIVYDMAKAVGNPRMHPHALRHHFGTRLSRAGVPIERIKELMGHEDINTTKMYITLNLADLFEAARQDPREQKKELRAVS